MKNLFFISLLVLFISCDSKPTEITLASSSGRMNNVLIVVNDKEWQGKIGDVIRENLKRDVLGLPQNEAMFNLNQISKTGFNSFVTATRNIVFVEFDKESSFEIKQNIYAAPQKVLVLKAPNQKEMIALIRANANEIIKTIKDSDIKLYQKKHIKKFWKPENMKLFNALKIKMRIPYEYGKANDSDQYVWFVKDLPNGYQNILVYSVPILSEADENGENIIATRDLKGKYVPGPKKSNYMITEKAYKPHQLITTIAGLKAYETRGKWDMYQENEKQNAWMAGPFLNYTIVDKKNNRLIVVEGFTYAPNKNKKNYMFELEAILKTIEIE